MRDHAKELQDAADFIEAHPGGYDIHTSLLREAAAEIERLRAASQWKPIETAPKDGAHVMLWCRDDVPQVVAGFYCEHDGEKWWQFSDEVLADIQPEGMEPSHWMPLPSHPTQEGDK